MIAEKTIYHFGATTIAKGIHSADDLRRLLVDPLFNSDTIIIKPNWMAADPGEFTDATTLRMLFDALGEKRVFVVESYSLARAFQQTKRGRSFTVGEKVVDWRWLLKGEGWRWLIDHPDWDWFRRDGHWEQLREEENAFLERFGFAELFQEYNVSYINVTEEVWSGRAADPAAVQQQVEARFRPLQNEAMYGMVPQRLFDLRGSTLISLARLKMYASFTFKNLFGLLPDPLKTGWHGPGNCRIATSIVEINKVYHALFNMYGICEAFTTTAATDPQGQYRGIFAGRYNLADGGGFAALGRDLLSMDALLLALSDPARRHIEEEAMRHPLALAEEEFGAIDQAAVAQAKASIPDFLKTGD